MLRTLRKRLPLLIGLLVVGLVVAYVLRPTTVPVEVARAERGPLRVTVDEDGKTRIRDRYVVSAPLTGRLVRIALRPGDEVRAGQTVLATIEPRDPELLDASARAAAEARVKAAETAQKQTAPVLEKAQAAHAQAVKELERARAGRITGAVPPQDLDTAVTRERTTALELRTAQFATQIAGFELEQARAALLRTRAPASGEEESWRLEVRSPIDGRVLRVFQESATIVTPGLRLLELGDPADLELEIDILSTDAVKVRPGAPVLLEHWGGEASLRARVRLVEPAAFTKVSALGVEEQRVNVIATFIDPPEKWRSLGDAYRVEARIVVWEAADVLKVPAGAVFPHADGKAVFVVAGGVAHLRVIKAGHSNGLETEVLDGLEAGAEVIVYPGDKVRDGVRVKPRD
ncbi:MAG TPA: HlyD family efflux transporter periplasmic adaptor subunit [Gemmataceae bacterium]|nr:HlyD family efflux transporter periplasmic adaptor subunit [Gemmataceae bacterium]